MIVIRMRRAGRKNLPLWRVVVTDQRAARDGRAVEILGHYDPKAANEVKLQIKVDRVKYWLQKGAQCSNTMLALLAHIGIDSRGGDITPRPWKPEKKKVKPKAEEKPPAEKPEEAAPPEEAAQEKPQEPKAEEKPAEEPKAEAAPAEEAPTEDTTPTE